MDETGQINQMPDMKRLRAELYSYSITDAETKTTIQAAYQQHRLVLEPHGAVGWAALQRYRKEVRATETCISLETADPAKFPDTIKELLHIDPPLPLKMAAQQSLPEHLHEIPATYARMKDFLRKELG